jgi:hypothetical protein
LVQIRDTTALGTDGVDLPVEASKLSREQFIPGRLAMSGYCALTGEQRSR